MSLRKSLQLALIVLAAAVTALIAAQWRGGDETVDAGPDAPEVARDLLSRTADGLLHQEIVNGVLRYQLRADVFEGFRDGRSEYTGNVRVDLYPVPEEEGRQGEPTRISGQMLQVQAAADQTVREVHVRNTEGSVQANLANGVELLSPELVYEAASGFVRTDSGVLLRHAGLLIEAKSLRYHTDRRTLEIWSQQGVGLRADPEGAPGAAPAGLEGRADSLLWTPSGPGTSGVTGVRLRGLPDIELGGAAIAGNELQLDVDPEDARLRAIRAIGEGRAVWSATDSQRALEAGEVTLELGDDMSPRVVTAGTVDGRRPLLQAGAAGEVEAGQIDLFVEAGGRGSAVASDSVEWQPGEVADLRRLRADRLELGLGDDGPESARASGGVQVEIERRDAVAEVTGERVDLTWTAQQLSEVSFPVGLRYRAAGASLSAAQGTWSSDSGLWHMEGAPRPRYVADDLETEADEMSLASDGGVEATGNVEVELRGDQVATVGPMLGGADVVNASAGSLRRSGGELQLDDDVQLWHEGRLLQAGEVSIFNQPARLEAAGDVLLVLGSASGAGAGVGSQGVRLSGQRLLAEGDPPELRLAQQATMRDGERRISGAAVVVRFDAAGGWRSIEVVGATTMSDPSGTASGEGLLYDPSSGEITVTGTPTAPATFTDQRGMEIRDPQGLRLRWQEETVEVTALQQGTTQTVRRRGGYR